MSESSTVEVHITVQNANGQNSEVIIKDFIRPGDCITERISKTAGEAADLAWRKLAPASPFVVDRTQ